MKVKSLDQIREGLKITLSNIRNEFEGIDFGDDVANSELSEVAYDIVNTHVSSFFSKTKCGYRPTVVYTVVSDESNEFYSLILEVDIGEIIRTYYSQLDVSGSCSTFDLFAYSKNDSTNGSERPSYH